MFSLDLWIAACIYDFWKGSTALLSGITIYIISVYLWVSPDLQKDDGLFVRPGDFPPVLLNAHSRLWGDTKRKEHANKIIKTYSLMTIHLVLGCCDTKCSIYCLKYVLFDRTLKFTNVLMGEWGEVVMFRLSCCFLRLWHWREVLH